MTEEFSDDYLKGWKDGSAERQKILLKRFGNWRKEFIKKLKENWRKKCNKMEIMSGDVAIFELESELDKLLGNKLK